LIKVNQISVPNLSFDTIIEQPQDLKENNLKANIDYIKIQSILKISRHKIDFKMLLDDIRLINKDVPRTTVFNVDNENGTEEFVDDDINDQFHRDLHDILITFAAFHQNVNNTGSQGNKKDNLGYTQG
jgi:hypothetical protein